jgi:hypothetical protein
MLPLGALALISVLAMVLFPPCAVGVVHPRLSNLATGHCHHRNGRDCDT